MAALQSFLRDELHRRDWSTEEFARRAGISTSSGYLIVRDGKDNVRQDTFDGIAAALSMTPAELSVAIGKGTPDLDPIEQAIRERTAEFREAVRDTVRVAQEGRMMTANPRQPLELVEGTIEATNDKGVRINGVWLNRSQFTPVDLPGVGARVCLKVDAKRFIQQVDVLEHTSATASLSRNETITRLAVLKAAAMFCASRPDAKAEHEFSLAAGAGKAHEVCLLMATQIE